jgi:serine/threonine-protein kinase PRP4
MFKAGLKEIQHLELSRTIDPEGKFHCVQLYEHFEVRNHLCLVFEPMKCNLRQLIKKIGAGSGFNLDSCQRYASQLFKALHHMKKCKIIHADLKPDNILISEDNRCVKICDFGSALKSGDIEITEILGSRFYRAPEIMIGLMFLYPIDMWSMACVLYECYTGKILYKGKNNNQMLLYFQKVMLKKNTLGRRKGEYWNLIFINKWIHP